MPRCDKMLQLHRFSWTAIEYSTVHSEVRRISSESRRGSRMRLEGSAGGSVAWRLPDCGSKYPGARARHRPRRGLGYQFVSPVSPSLCSTFFSRVGP